MILLVFLLEEPSAKILLDELLPKVLPDEVSFLCIPHEGKQDLEKSIPVKLRNWNVPNSWFVVMRDKDQGDSIIIQRQLEQLCTNSNRPETLVRIVVHELESWFLGDLEAVGKAFNLPKLSRQQETKKFRNPDALANAQEELKKLVKGYQKMSGARKVTPHLTPEKNCSESFNHLLQGLDSYIERIQEQ